MSRRSRRQRFKQKPTQPKTTTQPTAIKELLGTMFGIESKSLELTEAATILPRNFEQLEIYLVGCGGTGGFLALHLSRLAKYLHDSGTGVHLFFCDPDRVEDKNIYRQHFCEAEIGRFKAETLATRYGHAFGINVSSFTEEFSSEMVYHRGSLSVILGCVDNAAARKSINESLKFNQETLGLEPPLVWYLDCGNGETSGQVTLGSSFTINDLKDSFIDERICEALPSPLIQHPNLCLPRPEELANNKLSCAEMMLANVQGFNINAAIAVQAAQMLTQFVLLKNLDYHSVDVGLAPPVVKPTFTTIEEISRITRKPVEFLRSSEQQKSVAA